MILTHGCFMPPLTDTVVRFLPAGAPVSFQEIALQTVYCSRFSGDPLTLAHKQLRTFRLPMGSQFVTVVLAGFDCSAPNPFDQLRQVIRKVGEELLELDAREIFLEGLEDLSFAPVTDVASVLAMELPLCEYRFDKYLSQKKAKAERTVTVSSFTACQDALDEGAVLARSVMEARDLVNEIADVMTPMELARQCRELGKTYGFQVDVLDREACRELGMGLYLGVAKGSTLEPAFIVMHWNGGPEDQAPIAFVGKGITYDSGGLALKKANMEHMRFDMNGAGAVIGAMCAISARKLPHNVVAAVAACENAVGAGSYRNGDILTSMNGKTVFVQNTDGEGRLTMADAMTYCIRKEHPSELLEVGGLTGSVSNFFGNICAATLTTHPAMYERLTALSPITGEKFAQLPAFPEYRELLKSPFADLNNAPTTGAAGIMGGFFLESFHEDTPFIHVDFGATPFNKTRINGVDGATGFGVKSLYHYVKQWEPL